MVRPLKRLGQSFLVSGHILEREVEAAGLDRKDVVLEIGPGPGNLTEKLALRAGRVVAIEKDRRFRPFLEKLPTKNVEVIYGDALKVKLPTIKFTKCVSNLPYHISSKFTFRLLEECDFTLAVLSYQKEFAERMMAKPGEKNYGRLPAAVQFLASVEPVMKIGRQNYWPVPKVDSMLVRIVPKPRPENWARLSRLINLIFQQPGKTVRAVLKKKGIKELPKELEKKRVRQLTKEDILKIFEHVASAQQDA